MASRGKKRSEESTAKPIRPAAELLEWFKEQRERDADPALYDFTHSDTIIQSENRIYAEFEIIWNRPGASSRERYDAQIEAVKALMSVFREKRHGYSSDHLRTAFLQKRQEMANRLRLDAAQLSILDRFIEESVTGASSFTAGGRGVPILPQGSRAPESVKIAYEVAYGDYLAGARRIAALPEADRVREGDELTDGCRLRIFEAWAEHLLTLDLNESDFDSAVELTKQRAGELADWRLIEKAASTAKVRWRQKRVDRETTRGDAAAENVKPILNDEAPPNGASVNEPPQDTPRAKEPLGAANLPQWAEELRRLREEKQFSREKLAREMRTMRTTLGITITAESIKKHEKGRHYPVPAVRAAYAKYHGVEENKIFTR